MKTRGMEAERWSRKNELPRFFGKKLAFDTACRAVTFRKKRYEAHRQSCLDGRSQDGERADFNRNRSPEGYPIFLRLPLRERDWDEPEELIAAAHAGCFSMALSAELGGVGIKPEKWRLRRR